VNYLTMASSSTADSVSPDPSQQSLQERERFLQAWTSNSCSNESVISLEEGWDILDRYGIKMIEKSLMSNSTSEIPMGTKGFASLYTISYKLSTSEKIDIEDFSKVLYDRCKLSVENYIRKNIEIKLAGCSGVDFLKVFIDGWKKHKLLTSWMWRLFMNLDKTVVRTEALPTITSCCLKCFYELVFSEHLDVLRRGLLDCTAMDREGTLLDNSIIKEVIEVNKFSLN
jgi:Cullin family